jgi:predicted phage terminase large subunit-like protein
LKKQLFLRTLIQNQYIPHRPTIKQAQFLLLDNREALFGGAAGGGKSEALLMAALQHVMVPGYSAVIFRRSFTDLCKQGALIDRAFEWLSPKDAKWDGQSHIWKFPSGAKLGFSYLENDRDVYHHQSAEYQYIGFDELTQFTEFQYRYMMSRLRRLEASSVPLRVRTASNPGGVGHDWVKQRFLVEGVEFDRAYVPAKLADNPFLDQRRYVESLNELDPITRRQYLDGDWSARHGGSLFQREWFQIVADYPHGNRKVRYWDKAATQQKDANDPDWTVGLLLTECQGIYYVLDVKRVRAKPLEVENLIKQTAQTDNQNEQVTTYMEQEPGSSGVEAIDHYNREVLKGFAFHGDKVTGSKIERATPISSASEAGNFKLVRGVWNSAFLDEFEAFPEGGHDDIVDACSGALNALSRGSDVNPAWIFG